jgi:hypothetical protein
MSREKNGLRIMENNRVMANLNLSEDRGAREGGGGKGETKFR